MQMTTHRTMRSTSRKSRNAMFIASAAAISSGFLLSVDTKVAQGQTSSISFSGATYTQNFDTLTNTAGTSISQTTAGPFDVPSSTPVGWQYGKFGGTAVGSKFTVDDGNGISGSAYSYGTAGSTERAFGTLGSGSVFPLIGAVLVNNSGQTYTGFTITFTAEQWRRGSLSANTDSFSYALGAANIADTNVTFTSASALNFTAPNTTGANTALDGNLAANQTLVTATIGGLSWAPGQTLAIRWSDPDDGGSDDGIGIDHFSFNGANVKTLTWNPGANRNWNTTDTNWKDQSNATSAFTNADLVNFTDVGVGSVQIAAGGVQPSAVSVSNSSGTYQFLGGPLAGGAKGTKTNGGTLDLGSAANTFNGGLEIDGGVVTVAADSAMGAASAPIILGGGTLKFTANVSSTGRTLSLPTAFVESFIDTGANSGTLSQIVGGGDLTKLGTGTLTSTFTYNVTGQTHILAGTLVVHQTGGTATFTPGTNGGQFVGNLVVDGPFRINLQDGIYSGGGSILVTTSGAALSNGGTGQFPVISANVVLNSNSAAQPFVTTIGGVGGNSVVYNGVISGASDVNISSASATAGGSGTVIFNKANTWTGATNINNGSVGFVVAGIDNALPTTTALTFGTGSYAAATGTLAGTNGPGILDLKGHTLTVSALATGAGTNATVSNARILSTAGAGTLIVNQSTATTYAGQLNDGTGSIASGTLTINLGNGSLSLTKSGSGTLTLSGPSTYTGTTTVSGGAVAFGTPASYASALSGSSKGTNITNTGRVIFHYAGDPNAATFANNIRTLLTTSYNNNGFNNTTAQLRSTTANGSKGLGWVEDTTTTPADPTVTVATALYGDGDLSGTVDLTDFTFLAANFNGSPTSNQWLKGDYNYDGSVGLTDFTFLAANFNQTLTAPAGSLGAAVPEPMSLGLLAAASAGMLARRRRSVR
jgi:autotransporter-associated beta strand protein